jgi:prefoldin subunit 4
MELELADEDEPILYKIAASFYHLKPEEASERVSKSIEELDASIEALEGTAAEYKDKMDELKSTLYAKFGGA